MCKLTSPNNDTTTTVEGADKNGSSNANGNGNGTKTTTTSTTTTNNNLDIIQTINQEDIDRPRNEYVFGLPLFMEDWIVQNMLKHKQRHNITIVYVMINVLVITIPSAMTLFYIEQQQQQQTTTQKTTTTTPSSSSSSLLYALGVLYVVFNLKVFARSFILGLHYSTHVPIFNSTWGWLNYLPTTLLCNFFGMPIWTYYAHHIAMHHRENNVAPHDVSSTMEYQRDSYVHHFRYMFRYLLLIWFELPYHLLAMERPTVAAWCVTGIVIYFTSITMLYSISPIATTFVFNLPTIILSLLLMEGNWKQHCFVDPDDPNNYYKSTFTCINNTTNALNFNDGYHIEHHKNPSVAWYDLPYYFQKQQQHYVDNDAFIFTGVSSGQVGSLVLKGKLDVLADHYVNIGQPTRTKSQLIAEFQRRLQPVVDMNNNKKLHHHPKAE